MTNLVKKKYVKKPLVVEAAVWNGEPVSNFSIKYKDEKPYQLLVVTLEGIMVAEIGDYLIKGIKDEIYPCKPDIFKASYDEVFDDTPTSKM